MQEIRPTNIGLCKIFKTFHIHSLLGIYEGNVKKYDYVLISRTPRNSYFSYDEYLATKSVSHQLILSCIQLVHLSN